MQHVFHCDNYFHSYDNFNVFDNDNANVGNPCLKICCTEIQLSLWLPPLIITRFQLNIPELLQNIGLQQLQLLIIQE